nr:putative uncharacterized protein DDB_G0271606 [Labrus bergylta]
MEQKTESESLSWGDIMDMEMEAEDLVYIMPWASSSSCQQNLSREVPTEPQDNTPSQRVEEGKGQNQQRELPMESQDNTPSQRVEEGQGQNQSREVPMESQDNTPFQRVEEGQGQNQSREVPMEPQDNTPSQRVEEGQGQNQQRELPMESQDNTPSQRVEEGQGQNQSREVPMESQDNTPFQRVEEGQGQNQSREVPMEPQDNTPSQREEEGQGQNQQREVPIKPQANPHPQRVNATCWQPARGPLERGMRQAVEHTNATNKTKLQELRERVKEERNSTLEREKDIRMLKEQLNHLNPSFSVPDMKYYSCKTKEELIGVIEAQNKKLQERASGGPKLDETLRAENNAREKEMKAMQHQLHEETSSGLDLALKLKAQEEASRAMQKEMEELQKQLEMYKWESSASAFTPEEDMDFYDEDYTEDSVEETPEEVKEETKSLSPSSRAPEEDSNTGQIQELLDFKLIEKLNVKEETSQVLQKEVEVLQMQLEKQTVKWNNEPSLQKENNQKDYVPGDMMEFRMVRSRQYRQLQVHRQQQQQQQQQQLARLPVAEVNKDLSEIQPDGKRELSTRGGVNDGLVKDVPQPLDKSSFVTKTTLV